MGEGIKDVGFIEYKFDLNQRLVFEFGHNRKTIKNLSFFVGGIFTSSLQDRHFLY